MIFRSIRRFRRIIQVGTALAFIAIPLLNAREIYFFVGNMVAFNAGGVPLADPLAMLQAAAAAMAVTPAMLVGAGLSLLLAMLLGPVFCSWLCPFGLLSELAHRNKQAKPSASRQRTVPLRPFITKVCIAGAGLLAIVFLLPMPILTQLSMPGWFTRFWQHAVTHRDLLLPAAIAIPLLLIMEAVAGKRLWCRYVCPQSVLISLAGLLLPGRFQVRFTRNACTCKPAERVCGQVCSLDLDPRKSTRAQKTQCTNCGDCIDACRSRGCALSFGFAQSSNHIQDSKPRQPR